MQVNSVSTQNFRGITIKMPKDELEKAISKYVISAKPRARLAEKIARCQEATDVNLIVKKSGDVLLLKQDIGVPYEVKGSNLAKRFIKALNMAIK